MGGGGAVRSARACVRSRRGGGRGAGQQVAPVPGPLRNLSASGTQLGGRRQSGQGLGLSESLAGLFMQSRKQFGN